MASESNSSIGTLAGLANALTVAFVILKLGNYVKLLHGHGGLYFYRH